MVVLNDLLAFAERAIELHLRRENPMASKEDVETAVNKWRRERPGAPFGDCSGPVQVRPIGKSV